ncbi:MAG: hypothetical protein ABIQ31_21750 [Ferruginibacter sp.]
MKNKFYLFFPVLSLVALACNDLFAQKPAKTQPPAAASYKKPLVKSWLGKINGNATLNATEAITLVGLPLKITDDKNIEYVISSYQFLYKRIGVTEDEVTGKTSPQSDITANNFTTTPLPAVWQKNIVEGLHQGEELYFFDIIVFDKQGHRFFAPELKITIQ